MDLDQLVHVTTPQAAPSPSLQVFEGTIASAPDAADRVDVVLPGFDPDLRHGPCPYMPRGGSVPARGMSCLVAISDQHEPWVVAWWHTGADAAPAPGAHHATHEPGGSDPMAVDSAAATGSLRTLGAGAQQAASGTDSRLSNARTPTAHHASHEPGGTDAMAVDAAAATGSLRTLGSGAAQAAQGTDARFPVAGEKSALAGTSGTPGSGNKYVTDGDSRNTNARTPTSHATSHQPGGTDAMAVDAAAATGSLRTLGTGAAQAASGTDSRLSDTRTPTSGSVGVTQTGTGTSGLAVGYFSAYLASAQSATSADRVPYDTEEKDVSGWFDSTGTKGTFTPLIAGYYRLSARVESGPALTTGRYWRADIFKNGSLWKQGHLATESGNGVSSIVVATVEANGSTDAFDIRITHSNGGTVALATGITRGYFSGELIGKS